MDINNPEGKRKPCPVSTALFAGATCRVCPVHPHSLRLFEHGDFTLWPQSHSLILACCSEWRGWEGSGTKLLSGIFKLKFIY